MAGVISVRLPDGSQRELAEGTTAGEFAQLIGPRLAKAAVVATVDGHQVDLSTSLVDGAEVAIVTADSDAGARCCGTRPPTSWPKPCCDCGRGPSTPSAR